MKKLALFIGLFVGLHANLCFAEPWAQWRGPSQNGISDETGLPTEWSPKSLAWKTQFKGDGQSSPVVWEDRIFLTEAIEQGRQRAVMCINRNDGQILWHRVVWTGEPEPSHGMNRWASATCATDGMHVYAFLGRGGGMFCLSMDGDVVWEKNLGTFEGPWGTAACPRLVGDLVIQNCDSDKDAYIIALNKKTGEQVWKTARPTFRGWSSPIVVKVDGRLQTVVNGHTGTYAYDVLTGKEAWVVACNKGRGTPTVTPHHGTIYVVNGLSGGGAYAIRPGGSGDVTASHRKWFTKRGGRDLPSPIVVGNTMLVMSLRGAILSGYNIKTGEETWKERVGGQISASPVSFGGLAFFVNEAGETVVVDPVAENKIVRRNSLNPDVKEIFRAAITPSEGQVLIRSNSVLYCIGQRAK